MRSTFIVLMLWCIICFFIVAIDDGTGWATGFFSDNILPIIKIAFVIIIFPTRLPFFQEPVTYFFGFFIGCICWSIAIEFVIIATHFFKTKLTVIPPSGG